MTPWRRLLTVPGYLVVASLWLVATPVWLALAAVVDLLRRSRGVALRSAGVLSVYLFCELAGMVASAAVWLSGFVW